MKPTTNQQQFLSVVASNVLVSASAGCGKTTTMIQKLIQLLLQGDVKVSELLVVTFTNAAGAEMKQKLYKELYKTILTTDLTVDEKNNLVEQLEEIGGADIGTLHGYCKKLVEKYFYVIDLDPKFVVLEDNEQQYLLHIAIERVLKEYTAKRDALFANVFEYFNKSRGNSGFTQALMQLHSYFSSKADKHVWQQEKLDLVKYGNFLGEQLLVYLGEYFKEKFASLADTCRILQDQSKLFELDKYSASLNEISEYLDRIERANSIWELDSIVSSIPVSTLKVRKSKNIQPDYLDFVSSYDTFIGENKPGWDSFRGVVAAYKKYVQFDLGALQQERIVSQIELVLPLIEKLFEIEEKLTCEYEKLKTERQGLDFNDLEQKALLILSDSRVRSEISKKYKAIFVDEYQDISDAQEKIIESLHTSNSLYMIGDVKQSIYAFRHCTPAIFLEKQDRYAKDGKENILLGLNDNFRSDSNILQWVNFVCDHLMTKQTIGIDYKSTSRLNSGSINQTVQQSTNVVLNILPSSEGDKEEDLHAQAQSILSTIVKYVGQPYYHIAKGTYEKLDYKDFAILTHNKGRLVEEIYTLLTENEIPVSASFNSNLFHTEEIGTLIAILKVLNNTLDDEAFATLLLSPIIGLTEADLVSIGRTHDNFVEDVFAYVEQDNIHERLNQCYQFIRKYRHYLEHHTVVECLKEILCQYDLFNYYGTLPDGLSRVNKIKLFLSVIDNDSIHYSVKQVLDYIDQLRSKENFEIVVASQDNAVQIMTMHKSKGLEYPFVILAGLGTQFNEETLRQDIVISDKFGIGMRSRDLKKRTEQNNLLRSVCILDKVEEEKKEEIRLLYVAMTRAKNYLYMIGCKKDDKPILKQPLQCRSHLEMILATIPQNVQEVLYREGGVTLQLGKSELVIINGLGKDTVTLKTQDKPLLVEYPTTLYDRIATLCKTNDTFVKSDPIALKNTVSEMLMMEEENYVQLVDSPESFKLSEQKLDTISASDRGTAYHKVMEKLNFDFSQNAQKVIDDLVATGGLSVELKNQINIDKINGAILTISQFIDGKSEVFKEAQFMYKDKHCNLVSDSTLQDDILIQGMVDLFIKQGNKCILLDYKTNRHMTELDYIAKYKRQLELYALALKDAYHLENLDSYIYSFDLEKLIKISS